MVNPSRKLAFVLASTEQGSLIVSRLDYHTADDGHRFGVGHQLLETGYYDSTEIDTVLSLLQLRRRYFGDGVVAIDCGANIGVHAISWARQMTGWGKVVAIEAQERIYYALAGNIALSNCFNLRAIHAAAAASEGELRIPVPDYLTPSSFGSLELRQRAATEYIGQKISYEESQMTTVRAITLDSLGLTRVDLIKIDVEGMETDVLQGAAGLIGQHHPLIMVEHIKAGENRLTPVLDAFGYTVRRFGMNLLAIHPTDQTGGHIRNADG